MIFYVAASLPDRADAAALAAKLRERGHEVTSEWHDDDGATVQAEAAMNDGARFFVATDNLNDLVRAECVAVLHTRPTDRFGKWIEAAFARGKGKHLVVVGEAPIPTMAMPMPHRVLPSAAALLEYAGCVATGRDPDA